LGGAEWFNDMTSVFTVGFLGVFNIPLPVIAIFTALIVQFMMWYMTYFLYKRKVFITI